MVLWARPVAADAEPVLHVDAVACPEGTDASLGALIRLESQEPLNVGVLCAPTALQVDVTHASTGRLQRFEADPVVTPDALRNVALQIAELGELLAEPEPEPEAEPLPPAPVVPSTCATKFWAAGLEVGVTGRAELRGGAQLAFGFGDRVGLRVRARARGGPEPGSAVRSLWITALGVGVGASFGSVWRGDLEALTWGGIAIAQPGQAFERDVRPWFGGSLRLGLFRSLGAVQLGLPLEVGLQRRIDRRIVDEEGRLVDRRSGSILYVGGGFELRWMR